MPIDPKYIYTGRPLLTLRINCNLRVKETFSGLYFDKNISEDTLVIDNDELLPTIEALVKIYNAKHKTKFKIKAD